MGSRIRDNRLSDAAGSGAAVAGGEESLSSGLGAVERGGRSGLRLLILLFSLAEVGGRFFLLRLRHGSRLTLWHRVQWLHQACGIIARRIGIRIECRGQRAGQGLVCSNHLSYLDILVYAAAMPCVFVAKREVNRWPAFGALARCGGTIFVDRTSRAKTDETARQVAKVLESGVPVLLFPEGTSTDGSTVQRFHPSLLEPAVQSGAEMTPAAIGYRVRGGEEREICWYGDDPFTPHLLRTLGRSGMVAEVEFYPERDALAERKAAALELRDKVEAMRKRMVRAARQE